MAEPIYLEDSRDESQEKVTLKEECITDLLGIGVCFAEIKLRSEEYIKAFRALIEDPALLEYFDRLSEEGKMYMVLFYIVGEEGRNKIANTHGDHVGMIHTAKNKLMAYEPFKQYFLTIKIN